MQNPEQGIGDVLFADSSIEAKKLIDSIDRVYRQEVGKVTESAQELGHGYGIAIEKARCSPRLAASQEFFSVDFNWLDRMDERERLNGLDYSELPGAHELHLRWRISNRLFPKERRIVTQAEIFAAALKDDDESRTFRKAGANLWEEAQKLDKSKLTSGDLLDVRQKADLLIERGIAIGPIAQKAVGGLETIRELTISTLKVGFPPEQKEKLLLAEAYHQKNARIMLNPFLCMAARTDSPITNEDFLPALLSQPFTDILTFLGGLDEKGMLMTKDRCLEILSEAEQEGYDGEKIRLAFDVA